MKEPRTWDTTTEEKEAMSADIIPPGDSGEFKITEVMLRETDAASLEAFQVLLEAEAHRRNLYVEYSRDECTYDVKFRWRPANL